MTDTTQHRTSSYGEILNEMVSRIHPNLFLFRSRSGNAVFSVYDAVAGLPTTNELAYLFYRGFGFPRILDGGVLPKEGLHRLENGWGMVVVPSRGDDGAFRRELTASASVLLMDCANRAVILSYPERLFWNVREKVYRLRRKLAAFRAA